MPVFSRRRIGRIAKWASLACVAAIMALGLVVWRSFESIPRFSDVDGTSGQLVPVQPGDVAAPVGAAFVLADPSLIPVDEGVPDEPSTGQSSSVLAEPAATTTTTIPLPLVDSEDVETFLLFSTGITGITDDEALAIGVSDPDLRGADTLTDVVMVLLVGQETDRLAAVSIPRDTWLAHRDSRINTVYASSGPSALAVEVAGLTGLRIDHVIRVDMMGFVRLTDAVGGVDMSFDQGIRDIPTGLELAAGVSHLDGSTALRLVRARHLETENAGVWTADRSSDFGRMRRQQQFLVALLQSAWSLDAVTSAPAVLSAIQDHVVIDDSLGLSDLIGLAQRIRSTGGSLPGYLVPASVGWVGPASVVFVDGHAARSLVIDVVEGLS
ncbi:MAG: LCP family protein [Acidimicrobiales bacterium]|jgi:LCP family protein required for cell wall assembly